MLTDRLLMLLAALAVGASTGFGAGWWVQGQRAEARVQSLMAAQAQRDRAAAEANRQTLARALAAADAATALAQSREQTARQTAQELRHALDAATSRTRQCLSADAVQLLNRSAQPGPGLRLPQTPGSATLPAAPAAPDPSRPAASEQAIAQWIVEARQMYEVCRGRVEGLRAWADAAQ